MSVQKRNLKKKIIDSKLWIYDKNVNKMIKKFIKIQKNNKF